MHYQHHCAARSPQMGIESNLVAIIAAASGSLRVKISFEQCFLDLVKAVRYAGLALKRGHQLVQLALFAMLIVATSRLLWSSSTVA
jgi:hypothetical protein